MGIRATFLGAFFALFVVGCMAQEEAALESNLDVTEAELSQTLTHPAHQALAQVCDAAERAPEKLALTAAEDDFSRGCFPCCFCCEGPGTCCSSCKARNKLSIGAGTQGR